MQRLIDGRSTKRGEEDFQPCPTFPLHSFTGIRLPQCRALVPEKSHLPGGARLSQTRKKMTCVAALAAWAATCRKSGRLGAAEIRRHDWMLLLFQLGSPLFYPTLTASLQASVCSLKLAPPQPPQRMKAALAVLAVSRRRSSPPPPASSVLSVLFPRWLPFSPRYVQCAQHGSKEQGGNPLPSDPRQISPPHAMWGKTIRWVDMLQFHRLPATMGYPLPAANSAILLMFWL